MGMGLRAGLIATAALMVAPAIAPVLAQTIDPAADALLRDLGTYIDGANGFTVDVQIEVDELSPRGQKIQYSSRVDLAVRGNDRVYAYEVGDLRDRTLWSKPKNQLPAIMSLSMRPRVRSCPTYPKATPP
ncbi:hypothetical protein C7293_09970 [filamentous cyanobacterium CCT1]|nr:hypothetical protein C7293_09970 [filamentous cyanobacterium CCT1]PSN79146.1 hypothetical protein C8B47_13195 [filamentous cyanobacterium CCP4]